MLFSFFAVGLRLIKISGVCFWLDPINNDKRSVVRKKKMKTNSYIVSTQNGGMK